MVELVKEGRMTFEELRRLAKKKLDELHPHGNLTTLFEARKEALKQLRSEGYSQ